MTFDPSPTDAGYARLLAGGRKPAPTKDGYIALLPYTTEQWLAFLKAAGRSDLAEDARRSPTAMTRNANIQKLYAALHEITLTRTTAEWMRICDELDIPATPIYALDAIAGASAVESDQTVPDDGASERGHHPLRPSADEVRQLAGERAPAGAAARAT